MGWFDFLTRQRKPNRSAAPRPAKPAAKPASGMELGSVTYDGHVNLPGFSGGGSATMRPTEPSHVEAAQLGAINNLTHEVAGLRHEVAGLRHEVQRVADAAERVREQVDRELGNRGQQPIIDADAPRVRRLPEPRSDT